MEHHHKHERFETSRLYINVADGNQPAGSSVSKFTIQLPNYYEGVVFLELMNATTELQKTLIQLEDWSMFGTSKGLLYWRYVDDLANQRSIVISENALRTPMRLRSLTFHLYNTNGTPKPVSTGGFEIEIYSLKQKNAQL